MTFILKQTLQVVVDDRGTADCEGQITFNTGDHNLGYCTYPPVAAANTREMAAMESFCGHFTCQGVIQLSCHMGSGCHGASYTMDTDSSRIKKYISMIELSLFFMHYIV